MEITFQYIHKKDIDSAEYEQFVEKYHGLGSYAERKKRLLWYWQLGDEGYRILVARRGENYVGQASAYRVEACINGDVKELWWGVDTFVLSEMRGFGIGKRLQKILHEDCTNFSSAWYSPLNGSIKKKCGAHDIMTFPFAYYPISCYYSVLLELGIEKFLKLKVRLPRLRLPWLYASINKLKDTELRQYDVQEIEINELPNESAFIEECLKDEQFHVVRSMLYLKWKYVDNTRTKCRVLRIYTQSKQVGLVVFSDLLVQNVVHACCRVVKIYDSVFLPTSGLTHKHIILFVVDYLRKRCEVIDGIKSLQEIEWSPSLLYPKRKVMLSTIDVMMLSSGYLTYMDQDMEG